MRPPFYTTRLTNVGREIIQLIALCAEHLAERTDHPPLVSEFYYDITAFGNEPDDAVLARLKEFYAQITATPTLS